MGTTGGGVSVRVKRRTLFGVALACALTVARGVVLGQQMQQHLPPGVTPKAKGATVFLDYDQEELDAAYDQPAWSPNQAELSKRNAQKSAAAIARLGTPRRMSYGPTDIEKLDLYSTTKPNAPTHIFVHGGAWRFGSAAEAAYQSEMFVDAGSHFVALDFTNVIATKGHLMTMAQQVRRAVAWVHQNAAGWGGNRNRLYISGHSSGGHLAAVALTTDWQKDFGLRHDGLKGGLCASGL